MYPGSRPRVKSLHFDPGTSSSPAPPTCGVSDALTTPLRRRRVGSRSGRWEELQQKTRRENSAGVLQSYDE